jgi:hypothetical protein
MKTIYLILSVLLLCGFRMPSVTVSVDGHLLSKSHKNVGGYYVFAKGVGLGDWGKGHTVTNTKGNFHLEFNAGEENDAAFYYVDSRKDTVLLRRVHNIPETSEVTFWIK